MKEISEQEALQRLTALCARAEHCAYEMTEKMHRWGIDEAAQARIMAYLTEHRYVDDERYARAFVLDKIRYNHWGRRKVEQALWQKHIDEDIRQRVLGEVDTRVYADMLRPLLQQKRRTTTASSPYELQQKLIRFALGRGFDFETIRQCLDVSEEDLPEEMQ
jgi:regulatory protein